MAKSRGEEVGACVRTLFESGTVGDLSDAELLERFAARSGEPAEAAFGALVERHGPMVLRVCRSVLGDRHDANDAFQATFLVAARRARSIWVGESLGPWLFRVAHRTALRVRKAEARRRMHEARAAERAVLQVADVLPDDLGSAIHEEIDRLPGNDRAAVVLCLLEGLTHQQAAQRLRWPVGTVESRLARARTRLRRGLTRRGLAPSAGLLAADAWSGSTAYATVPPALLASTAQAAAQFCFRGAPSAATAAALANGVLRGMLLARITPALAVSLLVGGLAFGTSLMQPMIRAGSSAPGSEPEPPHRPKAAEGPAVGKLAPVATVPPPQDKDRFTDFQSYVIPAPYRAVARLRARIDGEEMTAPGVVVWCSPDEALIVTNTQILGIRQVQGDLGSWHKPSNVMVNLPGIPAANAGRSGLVGLDDLMYVGEPIAYDLLRFVALVRTRTGGRRIQPAPIVPRGWKVGDRMHVLNVEFSKVKDYDFPAMINSTRVSNPRVVQLFWSAVYDGFECRFESNADRTAGALFTIDGFLAGIGNLTAVDQSDAIATFASPQSIHRLLDRVGLSRLIGDEDRGSLFGDVDVREALSPAIGDVSSEGSPYPGDRRKPRTPPRSDAPAVRAESDRIGTLERRVEAMDRKLDQVLEKLGGAGR